MSGEKAPVTFESTQSKLQTLLELSAVEQTDLLGTVDALEQTGTEEVKRNPRNLGHLAEWMVYALDGVDRMNEDEKVRPPLEVGVVADLQSKRKTYKKLVDVGKNTQESADQPAQPERTADRKA